MDAGYVEMGVGMGHSPQEERHIAQDRCFQKKSGPGHSRQKKDGREPTKAPGSLCSFRYGFHAFPPGLFLSFILPLFPFFPDPGLCQSKHTPESGQGYEKAGPGHRIPVGLEPAQLKAGDPFPSYPEQGKQGPEMERVPAPPVIIKIQIQGCQDQTHSRHIVMDAGCKKHTGAIKDQINYHIQLFSQAAFHQGDHVRQGLFLIRPLADKRNLIPAFHAGPKNT